MVRPAPGWWNVKRHRIRAMRLRIESNTFTLTNAKSTKPDSVHVRDGLHKKVMEVTHIMGCIPQLFAIYRYNGIIPIPIQYTYTGIGQPYTYSLLLVLIKLHWPLGRSLSRIKCTCLHATSVQPYCASQFPTQSVTSTTNSVWFWPSSVGCKVESMWRGLGICMAADRKTAAHRRKITTDDS